MQFHMDAIGNGNGSRPESMGGRAVPRHPRCRHSREAETQYLLDRDVLDAGIMSSACVAMAKCRRGFGSGCEIRATTPAITGVGWRHRRTRGQGSGRGEATLAALYSSLALRSDYPRDHAQREAPALQRRSVKPSPFLETCCNSIVSTDRDIDSSHCSTLGRSATQHRQQ
jgi:hypothetical protein